VQWSGRRGVGNEVGTGFRKSASDLVRMWDHHFITTSTDPRLASRAHSIEMASSKKEMRRVDLSTFSATALRAPTACHAC
jgi:hypothetical protein